MSINGEETFLLKNYKEFVQILCNLKYFIKGLISYFKVINLCLAKRERTLNYASNSSFWNIIIGR